MRVRYGEPAALAAATLCVATVMSGCGSECEPWASEQGGVCFPNDVAAALACEDADACDEIGSRLAYTAHFTLQRAVGEVTRDILTSTSFSGSYTCSRGGSIAVSGAQTVLTSLSWVVEADLSFSDCRDSEWAGSDLTLVDGTAHASAYNDMNGASADWVNADTYGGSATMRFNITAIDRLGRPFERSFAPLACPIDLSASQQGVLGDTELVGSVCGYDAQDLPPGTP